MSKKIMEIITICKMRRSLSDKLRYPYMRHDQRELRDRIGKLDVDIASKCRDARVSELDMYRAACERRA